MRKRVAVVMAVAWLTVAAGEARAQCPAPVITGFTAGPGFTFDEADEPHFRVGESNWLRIDVRDAATVDIDWGDSERETVGVRGGAVAVRHAYARPGRVQIVAVAHAPCGAASAPGGHTVPVYPPCGRTRGRDLDLPDCLAAVSAFRLSAGGLSTGALWLSSPCRDSSSNTLPEPPEAVAVPAACLAPDPRSVPGRLPVRPGGRVTIVLGAPATALRATVTGIGIRGRSHRARRAGRDGRVWRLRLPRTLTPTHDRLSIRARRAGGADHWRAGLRVRD